MATRITGTIIRGERNAVRNNCVVIPLLAVQFPEIAKAGQFGTINVRLDQLLDKSHADIWTRRVVWQPTQRTERRIEAFGFIAVKFECPLGGPSYDCWVILPEGSIITYRGNELEIIADSFIESVGYGVRCAVDIDHTPPIVAPPSFGILYGRSFS
jgi:hypothetical protein